MKCTVSFNYVDYGCFYECTNLVFTTDLPDGEYKLTISEMDWFVKKEYTVTALDGLIELGSMVTLGRFYNRHTEKYLVEAYTAEGEEVEILTGYSGGTFCITKAPKITGFDYLLDFIFNY